MKIDMYNNSALHIAAERGNVEGMDPKEVDARNIFGQTPLHMATGEAIIDLLAMKADVDSVDVRGNTPLHTIASRGEVGGVLALMWAGAVQYPNSDGEFPIHQAAARGHSAVAFLLSLEGDDEDLANMPMNMPDKWALTPLHVAAASNHDEVIRVLVENGADYNAKNDRGETPAQLAFLVGAKEAMQVLASFGTSIADLGELEVEDFDLEDLDEEPTRVTFIVTQTGISLDPVISLSEFERIKELFPGSVHSIPRGGVSHFLNRVRRERKFASGYVLYEDGYVLSIRERVKNSKI